MAKTARPPLRLRREGCRPGPCACSGGGDWDLVGHHRQRGVAGGKAAETHAHFTRRVTSAWDSGRSAQITRGAPRRPRHTSVRVTAPVGSPQRHTVTDGPAPPPSLPPTAPPFVRPPRVAESTAATKTGPCGAGVAGSGAHLHTLPGRLGPGFMCDSGAKGVWWCVWRGRGGGRGGRDRGGGGGGFENPETGGSGEW